MEIRWKCCIIFPTYETAKSMIFEENVDKICIFWRTKNGSFGGKIIPILTISNCEEVCTAVPDVVEQQEQHSCPVLEGQSKPCCGTTPGILRVRWASSHGHYSCDATSPSTRTWTTSLVLTCYYCWKHAPVSGRHSVVMAADQSHPICNS